MSIQSSRTFAVPHPFVERLESDWQNGSPQSLAHYVGGNRPDADVFASLVCSDLRWRWKSSTVDPTTSALENYLAEAEGVTFSDALMRRMIVAEFRARQTWGDKPRLQDYQTRFPRQFQNCVHDLKRTLFSLAKLKLSIQHEGIVVFETSIDRPLVLGRQSGGEHAPYCRIVRQDADRIVFAATGERQVSRNAIRVDLESIDRVSVLNQSTYTPVSLDCGTVIEPAASASFGRPLSITAGERVIAIQ